jgi:hypothetical protein
MVAIRECALRSFLQGRTATTHLGRRDSPNKAVLSAQHDLAQSLLFALFHVGLAATDKGATLAQDDHGCLFT